MSDWLVNIASQAGLALWQAFYGLIIPALLFAALAFVIKKRRAFSAFKAALHETRINLSLLVFNVLLVVPLLNLFAAWFQPILQATGIQFVGSDFWQALPAVVVILAAVFAGDFIGYWRHRLEHSFLLWPAHSVHHSDTRMTWLALERFHPINRFTTFVIDNFCLLALGLPSYALIANFLVRHYYGYFIHADLPFTYTGMGKVFVSPAMHRWHHAKDPAAYNNNYATIFSLFDRWFGTYRVPGKCDVPLGVNSEMGKGFIDQVLYPLKLRAYLASNL